MCGGGGGRHTHTQHTHTQRVSKLHVMDYKILSTPSGHLRTATERDSDRKRLGDTKRDRLRFKCHAHGYQKLLLF